MKLLAADDMFCSWVEAAAAISRVAKKISNARKKNDIVAYEEGGVAAANRRRKRFAITLIDQLLLRIATALRPLVCHYSMPKATKASWQAASKRHVKHLYVMTMFV